MKIILVLFLIFSSDCEIGNEHTTLLSQPHACYESTSTKRQLAFQLTEKLSDPPPVIRAVYSANSYNGEKAIRGSYTFIVEYLLLAPGSCSETITFGAKTIPSTPTHQIFVIKFYMPESDKSFSKIEFVTKIPLVSGTYLLRDDKNFMSLVGNFDHSLGVHFIVQPTVLPDYSKILVPALYVDKCACFFDGRKIHKLRHIDNDNYFVDVGNYKNIQITLTDTSNKKLQEKIFFKRFPAFPCHCVAWEDLSVVSSVIPLELTDGILTISFHNIDGISRKSAKWIILSDGFKIFDSSSNFNLENFSIIKPQKDDVLNDPIYLYLFKLDTLARSCGTNKKIKTTSRMLGTEVYEFTYSKEVDVEQGITQELTYYSSDFHICDKIEGKNPLVK